jgi:hypothetical protein
MGNRRDGMGQRRLASGRIAHRWEWGRSRTTRTPRSRWKVNGAWPDSRKEYREKAHVSGRIANRFVGVVRERPPDRERPIHANDLCDHIVERPETSPRRGRSRTTRTRERPNHAIANDPDRDRPPDLGLGHVKGASTREKGRRAREGISRKYDVVRRGRSRTTRTRANDPYGPAITVSVRVELYVPFLVAVVPLVTG